MEHSTCMQPTMTLGSSHVWEMIFNWTTFLSRFLVVLLKKIFQILLFLITYACEPKQGLEFQQIQ